MQINLNTIFKLLATLLVVSLIVLFSSCGARQAEKKRLDESSKTELIDKSKNDKSEIVDSNIKKSEVKTENKEEQTTTVKKTVEPIDPTKPASFTDEKGNKKELNNSKETTEITTKNNNTKSESKTDTEEKTTTDKKEIEQKDIKAKEDFSKKEKEIHVKRDAWSLWSLCWLLVPIYFIWKNWSKITDKFWWV